MKNPRIVWILDDHVYISSSTLKSKYLQKIFQRVAWTKIINEKNKDFFTPPL